MAGNTTKIDEVVDEVAITQFIRLKKAGVDLRTELSSLLQVCIDLTAALGGSTPATFAKNLKATESATQNLIKTSQQLQDVKNKEIAQQEKILNSYLISLSKQESARQAKDTRDSQRDAKEIAAAEAKQAKLDAIAARKANAQFKDNPALNPYGLSNPQVTEEPTNPTARYEPIIAGNENMAISATKSAEAIVAENAALMEQKEVLASLSVAQRANLELLLALQSERAVNASELKALTAEDVASGERLVFLTQRQLELSIAIRETQTELSRQTKEILASDNSIKQLNASVLLLSEAYEGLSIAERESERGQKMGAELAALRTQQNELCLAVKNTKNNIGNYTESVNKSTVATQLADKVSAQFVRSIIRMGVQFLLIGVIFKAAEWIYDYVKALDVFNPVATAAERAQKGLTEAFTSGDYEKGVANVLELGANLALVKDGVEDSDTAINKYNETIGKTFGYVNNINDAQQGFIDHKDAYIKTILDEAAAMAIANDAAKEMADLAVKNEELREGTSAAQSKLKAYEALGKATPAISEAEYQISENIKSNQKDILENSKRMDQIAANAMNAIKGLDTGAIQSGGQKTGPNANAELANKIANDALEHKKILDQKIISDDRESYKNRLSALADFYQLSKQIYDNNETLALSELPKNDARRVEIESKAANTLLALQEQTAAQRRQLLDKQYKQDQEILKNNLQTQVDLFKQIADDPNQSTSMKLIALDIYAKKSKELIGANYKEQVKQAGKNSESIKLAEQEKDKAVLQLDNQTAADRLKIHKDALQKILESSKESEQQNLEDLNQGAIVAAQVLQDRRDDALNAKLTDFEKGKISEKKYNREILAINDQYAVDRLNQELTVQRGILAIQEGTRDSELILAKQRNARPEELAKISSEANKGINGTNNKIATTTSELKNATFKQKSDAGKGDEQSKEEKKKELEEILGDAKSVTSETNDLIDKGYENQISKLEKIGQKIQENADIEKAAIDRSLDTQSNKARAQLILDAQIASQQKNIQREIAKEKHKQAVADKAAAIAEIILNTAIAVTKLPADGGLLGAAAIPVVIALGALQLAKVAATPIPQFAKGTPTGGHKGGYAVVGDGGGPELIKEPGRAQYYSPGVATMMHLPRGTVVEPYKMLPETPKWSSTRTDTRDVVDAIDRLARKEAPRQSQPRLSGWIEAQRQADAWNRYTNNRFK